MHKSKEKFKDLSNPAMLVCIEKLLMGTIRWVPICQGFDDFQAFFASFCIHQISYQQHNLNTFIPGAAKTGIKIWVISLAQNIVS